MKSGIIPFLWVSTGIALLLAACGRSDRTQSPGVATSPQTIPEIRPSPSVTGALPASPAATATIDARRRPGPGITTSAVMPDGSLWYAFDQFDMSGGIPPGSQEQGLYLLKEGRVSHIDIPGAIRALEVAPDGSLYVGAGCGLLRYRDGLWETLLEVDCDRRTAVTRLHPLDIAFGEDGILWVGGAFSLASYDGERWQEYDVAAIRVSIASDGAVWAIGWDGQTDSNCCLTQITETTIMTYTWTADAPVEAEVLQQLYDQNRR